MTPQLLFGLSFVFGLLAWSVLAAQYLWPWLRTQSRTDALRALLTVHTFRFLGLAFLVPGVVSPDLPTAFAHPAAFGDLVAAALALLAMALLRGPVGVPLVWVFNVWGAGDLINAVYRGAQSGLQAGQLGAAYFIPTFIVPLLLVTHVLIFMALLRRRSVP